MKKFFLFLISLLIGLAIFIWITDFIGWAEIKRAFLVFTGWQGVVILIVTLLMGLVATLKWKEILNSGRINIPISKLFEYYLATFSVMYLCPMVFLGGEALQGYLLKKKHNLSWSKGMASAIIHQVLDWTTNLVVIFFGIIFFILKVGLFSFRMTMIFSAVFLSCVLIISSFYFMVFKKESFAKFFLRFINHKKVNTEPLEIEQELFHFFKTKNLYFWKALFLAFLEEVFYILRIWFLLGFLGQSIGFLPVLSILAFSYLAMMVPIPGALGIHEGFQALSFKSFGLEAGLGAAFTLIIRGADLIVALIGLFFLFRLGSKLFGNELLNNNST